MGIPTDDRQHRSWPPRESQADWIALCVAVGIIWFAFAADVAMFLVYWGDHPESLHAFNTSCYLAVIFGAPTAALFCLVTVVGAKNRREIIPRFAWRFCVAGWILLGLVLACFIAGVSYSMIHAHQS
jgi:hypothetical protein